MKQFFSGMILFMLAAAGPALAHQRTYVWSQEYRTIPRGEFEIESHTTLAVPDADRSNVNKWTYETELEYGITDRLTLAHYELWQTSNVRKADDSTKYAGFKFEGKYRIGEKGKYWVDPLLYVEWKTDPRNDANPNAIEAKLILSKDFDKFNVTYNQIMDSRLGDGGRTKHEFTWGLHYEILESFYIGTEMKGHYWNPGSHRNELTMGPTLAYESKYFWASLGALFGLNNAASDEQVRLIVGVPF